MTYHRKPNESWFERIARERGERAVARQLEYQQKKSKAISDEKAFTLLAIKRRAIGVKQRIESFREIQEKDKILEVGCGAHGLIFGFENNFAVGIDPLASEYAELFPAWQAGSQTITAVGEEIPFDDDSFEIVLSDNVIDHANDPYLIMHELVRVLMPGGILFFTVNTHHPVYQTASFLHGIWNGLGLKFEISPFADHTIHFTPAMIDKEFEKLPVAVLSKSDPLVRSASDRPAGKGIEGKIKRTFPKNVLYEIIAEKK